MLAARRRDAILEAVAASASVLLAFDGPQRIAAQGGRAALARPLASIGCTSSRSRPPRPPTAARSLGISSGAHRALRRAASWTSGTMAAVGLGSWVTRLARGETIVGHVKDFEEPARQLFARGNVKSVVVGAHIRRRAAGGDLSASTTAGAEREWSGGDRTVQDAGGADRRREARSRHLAALAGAPASSRTARPSSTASVREPPCPLIFMSQQYPGSTATMPTNCCARRPAG